MDLQKYWPYLVLIIGAALSITVAFISIKSFSKPESEGVTATSTVQVATTTATAKPEKTPEQKANFFQNLINLFSFKGVAPRLPGTPTPGTSSSGGTGSGSSPAQKPPPPPPSTRPSQYPYTFAPTERPPVPTPPTIPPKDVVRLNRSVSTGSGNPANEYVVLTAPSSNRAPVMITGMKLKSAVTGNTATIGTGVSPYLDGQQNSEQAIELKPGGIAYIFTGRGPLSYSFQLNKCMGYLNQFYRFNPGIQTNCPRIQEKELPTYPNNFNDACLDYIAGISQCYDYASTAFPANIKPECKTFIRERNNYRYCVAHHRSDKDFEIRDWRIYLNRGQELWKTRREHIELYDQNDALLDGFTY